MQLSRSVNSHFSYFIKTKPEFQVPLKIASPGYFKKASTHRNNINGKEITINFSVSRDLKTSNLSLLVH